MFDSQSFSNLAFSVDAFLFEDAGTAITNATATTNVPTNYEICPISGFRQWPQWDSISRIRKRWDGQYVRAESLDSRHPQEFVESRGNVRQEGPQHAEPEDVFIADSVAPEDL